MSRRTAKTIAGKPIEGQICINTIATYLTGIQSFMDFHEIPITWKKIFRFIPESVPSNLRAYQKEEIRKRLSVADLRDRCIILIMASGGLRVGGLADLQVKHQSLLDRDNGIGSLKVYPNSKNDSYTTLLTPEAMDAMHSYMEWRKDHGERITDESPLIRDKFDVFTVRKNKPKPLKVNTIYRTMARLLDNAGICSEQLQPDHSFRYFFNSCLLNSDVNHSMKELLMGHCLKLDDFYYDSQSKESRNKILLEYMKAVDALTINEENRLRRENEMLKIKKSEIEEIKEQAEKYKSFMATLNPQIEEFHREINSLKIHLNEEADRRKEEVKNNKQPTNQHEMSACLNCNSSMNTSHFERTRYL
jgi:integrase